MSESAWVNGPARPSDTEQAFDHGGVPGPCEGWNPPEALPTAEHTESTEATGEDAKILPLKWQSKRGRSVRTTLCETYSYKRSGSTLDLRDRLPDVVCGLGVADLVRRSLD